MLKPSCSDLFDTRNHLVLQELNYDRTEYASQSSILKESLTAEQRHIYEEILSAVKASSGGFFFVCGFGGTGKTFLWNSLIAAIRADGGIAINVASSGIAATLLPSVRTAHSRFAIPIEINEDSTCNITHNSALCYLIKY
ncbi:hypothetical protein K1719_029230 [Acacia pycnantha]|nr:hypothetical protein K1719_029230 [Acacia pycnantha]